MKGLIETEWQSYLQQVVPENPSSVQVQETRRGFYAGAQSLLTLITKVGIDDVSEDQGVAHIERLNRELDAFFQAVGTGGA